MGAHLRRDGRIMEVLSEHLCQGWLEGYLLTGRHGLFNCYEAFIHIVDSMFNQHAKWLKVSRELGWRRPVSSLNYLLTSHVWRQDHNGFSHQDPGFIDLAGNKSGDVVRVYLPADANSLLAVAEEALVEPQLARGRQAVCGGHEGIDDRVGVVHRVDRDLTLLLGVHGPVKGRVPRRIRADLGSSEYPPRHVVVWRICRTCRSRRLCQSFQCHFDCTHIQC